MDEKKSRWDRIFKFFGEKGFYIVLFLCVAVIGVSAWMISGTIGRLEAEADKTVLSAKVTAVPTPSIETAPSLEPQPPATAEARQSAAETETVQSQEEETVETALQGKPMPEDAETMSTAGSLPDFFVWPTVGSIETTHSVNALLYNHTMADWRTHRGLDLATGLGSKVIAAAGGTVEQVYFDDMYGTTVVIHHGGGLRSIYSNLAEMPTVSVGDSVSTGDTIGSVGQTALAEIGDTTHLHFEMTLDGETVDPNDYLPVR